MLCPAAETRSEREKVLIRVHPISNSWYAAQIYAGLFDLAAAGEIKLEFTDEPLARICERDWGWANNDHLVYLELHRSGSKPIKVCYDMLDGPEIISLNGLEHCDVYFKRSYDLDFLVRETDEWHRTGKDWVNKVLPFGLNCPACSVNEYGKLKRALIFEKETGAFRTSFKPMVKGWFANPVGTLRGIATRVLLGNPWGLTPMREVTPDVPAEDKVLIQTRLFDPTMGKHFAAEYEELNQYRIRVVRLLKNELGSRFVGGFLSDPISQKACPDLLTQHRVNRRSYFELVKRCKVAVFTRGLRQSTGWRFPEFFAASRCIVSEPLAYGLPEPLVEGKHVVTFSSPEAALESCLRMLEEPDLARTMREETFAYYERNVRPNALVRNTLNSAIGLVDLQSSSAAQR